MPTETGRTGTNEPGFTPGPWKVDPTSPRLHPGYGDDFGFMVYGEEPRFETDEWGTAWVFSHSPSEGPSGPTDEFDELAMKIGRANAHLIAAAPELYEALEKCDNAFACWQVGQVPGRPEDILALITTIRAALAKARGGAS